MAGRYVTAFFTEYGLPKAGLAPSLTIWNVATNAVVVGPIPMAAIGNGFYKYWWAAYNQTLAYVLRADGGAALPVGERYKESANVIDDEINNKATQATANEILDMLENKLYINEPTSELWLYDDAGVNIVKKWPLKDHLGGNVTIVGHAPTNRDARTL